MMTVYAGHSHGNGCGSAFDDSGIRALKITSPEEELRRSKNQLTGS